MHNTRAGRIIFPALILVLVGLAFGVVDAVVRPIRLGRTTPPPPPVAPADTHPTAPPIESNLKPTPADALPAGHITIEQAKSLFEQQAPFIDARRSDVYVQGHVKGAIRLDLAAFANGDPALLGMIPRTGTIVIYCSGGHCDESEQVAKMLDGSGYKTVYVMHDGFPGWQAAGLPSETGEGIQP